MSIPAADSGWSRFIMKSKFGAGRDFEVTTLEGSRAYFVDGKIGTRPKADIRDAADNLVYNVRGKMLGFPKKMTIATASGDEKAHLTAKKFSIIKDKMTLQVVDGPEWHLEGTLMEKNYAISSDGRPIVRITQKWVTVRDKYVIDVADGVDPALALAVVWAVDRWVERD